MDLTDHFPLIRKVVGKYVKNPDDREDVFQDACVRLLEYSAAYRGDGAPPWVWVWKVTRSVAVNSVTRDERRNWEALTDFTTGVNHDTPQDIAEFEDLLKYLETSVAHSPDLLASLGMSAMGMRSAEIGAAEKITDSCARLRIMRARKLCRTAMEVAHVH